MSQPWKSWSVEKMRSLSLWVGLALVVLSSVLPLLPWAVQVALSLVALPLIVFIVMVWWQWWRAEASRRKSEHAGRPEDG